MVQVILNFISVQSYISVYLVYGYMVKVGSFHYCYGCGDSNKGAQKSVIV